MLDEVIAKGAVGITMFPSNADAGNEQITKMVNNNIPVVTLGGSRLNLPMQFLFCHRCRRFRGVGNTKLIDKLKRMD